MTVALSNERETSRQSSSTGSSGTDDVKVSDPGLDDDDPRQVLFKFLSDCGLSIILYAPVTSDVLLSETARLSPILRRSTHLGRGFLRLNQDPDTVWTAVEGPLGAAIIVFGTPASNSNLIFDQIMKPLDAVEPPFTRELATLGSTRRSVAEVIESADVIPVWEIAEFAGVAADGVYPTLPASVRRAARAWQRLGRELYKRTIVAAADGDVVDIYLALHDHGAVLATYVGENSHSELAFVRRLVDTGAYTYDDWEGTPVLLRRLPAGTDEASLAQFSETMANDFLCAFAEAHEQLMMDLPAATGGLPVWNRLEMEPGGIVQEPAAAEEFAAGDFTYIERVRESLPEDGSVFEAINVAAQELLAIRGAGFADSWRNGQDRPLSPSGITFSSARHDSQNGRIVAAGHPTHSIWGLPPAHDLGAIDGRNLASVEGWPAGGLLWPAKWLYVGSSRGSALVPLDASANVISVDMDPGTSVIGAFQQLNSNTGAVSTFSEDGRRRFLTAVDELVGNEGIRFGGGGSWLLVSQSRRCVLVEVGTGRRLILPFGNAAWWPAGDSCLIAIAHEDGANIPRLFSLESNEWVREFPELAIDGPVVPDYPNAWLAAVSPDGEEILVRTIAGVSPEFQREYGSGDRLARVSLKDGKGRLTASAFLDADGTLERDVREARWSAVALSRPVRLHPDLQSVLADALPEPEDRPDAGAADTAEQILVLTLNVAIDKVKAGQDVALLMPDILVSLKAIATKPANWEKQSEWLLGVQEQVSRFIANGTISGTYAAAWRHFCSAIAAIKAGKPELIDPLAALRHEVQTPTVPVTLPRTAPAAGSSDQSSNRTSSGSSGGTAGGTSRGSSESSDSGPARGPALPRTLPKVRITPEPPERSRSLGLVLGILVVLVLMPVAYFAFTQGFGSASPSSVISRPTQPAQTAESTIATPQAVLTESAASPLGPGTTLSSGASSTPSPSVSKAVGFADEAYCRGQGTLVWVATSTTFRGAFCNMNQQLTYIGLNRALGGTVSLAATNSGSAFTASSGETTYRYAEDKVTITTASKTFEEPTTAWLSPQDPALAHPGDLGLSVPISYPKCDDSVIVVYGTGFDPATNTERVRGLLQAHPGASYLRTDLSCYSFKGPSTDNSNGQYVYAVYEAFGRDTAAACQLIERIDTYGRWLSNTRSPAENALTCK
jgi:hypothetical protein